MSGTRVNKRIPVTDDTLNRLRDFSNGLGTTYDDAINFLIDQISDDGETAKRTGHRLRGVFDPAFAPTED